MKRRLSEIEPGHETSSHKANVNLSGLGFFEAFGRQVLGWGSQGLAAPVVGFLRKAGNEFREVW